MRCFDGPTRDRDLVPDLRSRDRLLRRPSAVIEVAADLEMAARVFFALLLILCSLAIAACGINENVSPDRRAKAPFILLVVQDSPRAYLMQHVTTGACFLTGGKDWQPIDRAICDAERPAVEKKP